MRRFRRIALHWLIFTSVVAGAAEPLPAQEDIADLIVELLNDKDNDVRALAYEQIRSGAQGEALTQRFAGLLPTLAPDAQVGLLSALASRGDMAAAPAVRSILADTKQEDVRIAAIEALGFLGGERDASLLIDLLDAGSPAQQQAARASLVRLPGPTSSAAIIAELQEHGAAARRVALIEILTSRRAGHAELLSAAVDTDPAVRSAAMRALSELAGPEHIPGMVQGVLKAAPGRERTAAEQAVAVVCRRDPEVQQQVAPLLTAMDALPAADRIVLLPTCGRIGGPAALPEAEQALKSSDFDLHTAGVTALCNWPDGSIAAHLLQLARTDEHPEHRNLALRALIRVAPLPDARSDQRRLDLLRTTFVMCQEDAERKLMLERAKAIRTMETLRFVAPYLDQPTFAQQACQTVVELAHHRNLREPNKAEFDRLLDRVIEVSRDATVIDRAQRYKQGRTWVRPTAADSP